MTPTVTALQQQLQQLRAKHAAGQITQAKFDEARTRLERQLLDELTAVPVKSGPPAPRVSFQTWALLGVVMTVVAAIGYSVTGEPEHINTVPGEFAGATPGSPHDTSEAQMAQMVEQLAQRMEQQPDDVDGWMTLGRSYAAMGRSTEALQAFDRARKLMPDNAAVLADYADALAVHNGRNLDGEPLKLIEQALVADPNHLKALALAGTAAFNRGDFAKAVEYWDRAVAVGPAGNPIVQMASSASAEARSRAGLAPAPASPLGAAMGTPAAPVAAPAAAAPAPVAAAPAPTAAPSGTPAAAAGAGVSGTVTLAASLRDKVSPDDMVYVFARAANGSRMPLALTSTRVRDLPARFTLDDSMAMSPANPLSSVDQIVVGARVSRSGQPMPRPGDFEGVSAPMPPSGSGVSVEISTEIK